MTEKWRLCSDVIGNLTIKGENQSMGKFIKLEEKQCQDIVDKLNEQDAEIQRLEKMNEELLTIIKGISEDSAKAIVDLWQNVVYE